MSDEASTYSILREIVGRLPRPVSFKIAIAIGVAVLVSVTQLGVVGSVALLGATLSSPQDVANAEQLAWVRQFLPGSFWTEPKWFLAVVAGGCLAAVLGNNVLRMLNEYCLVRAMRATEQFYSDRMLTGFFQMPYQWHMHQNSSDLVMAVYWASHYGAVVRSLLVISGDAFSALLVLCGVFIVSPGIALGAMVVLGLISTLIYKATRTRLDRYGEMYREACLYRVRVFNKGLQGIKDVKIFGCEPELRKEADAKMAEAAELAIKQEMVKVLPTYALESMGFLLILAMVFYLVFQDVSYATIAGTVTLVAAAGWKILPNMSKVLGSVTGLRLSWPYVLKSEKYHAELGDDEIPNWERRGHGGVQAGIREELSLRDISFSYGPDSQGVNDISMSIRKGQAVGLVGPSGAGKSTIINIVSGLLQPGSGAIQVDGDPLDGAAFKQWQVNSIGYVPQAPYICDGTIAENVAYGLNGDTIDMERVRECCEMASMDFIETLPEGIMTAIGERGVRLSGGQQQRIAIARAIYKNPEIIVFDEATSALDTKNERTIQETIYSLKGTVTLIIVAHRLTTVEGCDVVFWVDDGRVVMSGPPAEVLREYEKTQSAVTD